MIYLADRRTRRYSHNFVKRYFVVKHFWPKVMCEHVYIVNLVRDSNDTLYIENLNYIFSIMFRIYCLLNVSFYCSHSAFVIFHIHSSNFYFLVNYYSDMIHRQPSGFQENRTFCQIPWNFTAKRLFCRNDCILFCITFNTFFSAKIKEYLIRYLHFLYLSRKRPNVSMVLFFNINNS